MALVHTRTQWACTHAAYTARGAVYTHTTMHVRESTHTWRAPPPIPHGPQEEDASRLVTGAGTGERHITPSIGDLLRNTSSQKPPGLHQSHCAAGSRTNLGPQEAPRVLGAREEPERPWGQGCPGAGEG